MKKRVMSILLVVVMAIFMMPVTAFAEAPIDFLTAIIVTPERGKQPEYTAIAFKETMYSCEVTHWYKGGTPESPGPEMSTDDGFIKNTVYIVEVEYTPKAGYTFTDTTDVIISGVDATYKVYTEEPKKMMARVAVEDRAIYDVQINDFTVPVYGATADMELSIPADAHYHLATPSEMEKVGYRPYDYIQWIPFSPTGSLEFNDTTIPYFANIHLMADDGYYFVDNLLTDMDTTINGERDYINTTQTESPTFDGNTHSNQFAFIITSNFYVYKPIYQTAISGAGAVNVRGAANESIERIGGLKKDDVVDVLEEVTDGYGKLWYKIPYNGKFGYIMAEYTDGEPYSTVVVTNAVNVRTAPDASSERIGGLVKGKQVYVLANIDTDADELFDWSKIIFNGKVGYVESANLGGIGGGEVEYIILDGDDQAVDCSEDVTVRADGDITLFDHLEMDGEVVDPENYELQSGSTIAILKKSYLATLKSGAHKLSFVYVNGKAETNLYVANNTAADPGNSGSTANTGGAQNTTDNSSGNDSSASKTGVTKNTNTISGTKNTSSSTTRSAAANTGDENKLGVWIALIAIAGFGMAWSFGLSRVKRK